MRSLLLGLLLAAVLLPPPVAACHKPNHAPVAFPCDGVPTVAPTATAAPPVSVTPEPPAPTVTVGPSVRYFVAFAPSEPDPAPWTR